MNDKLLGLSRSLAIKIISAICLACVGGISWLFLDIAQPYYQLGAKLIHDNQGNSYQTILVVNPGPWATRDPRVEFYDPSGVTIVDWAKGVKCEQLPTEEVLSAEDGLRPGNSFYVTYKFATTNGSSALGVMCDGVPCKDAPSSMFTLNFILKALLVALGIIFVVGFIGWGMHFQVRGELRALKDTVLHEAVTDLWIHKEKNEGESDVARTADTVRNLKNQAVTNVQPKPVKRAKKGNDAQQTDDDV